MVLVKLTKQEAGVVYGVHDVVYSQPGANC
jgi:hypothetical protein